MSPVPVAAKPVGQPVLGPKEKPKPEPLQLRSFIDPIAARNAIFDRSLKAAREIKPLKNNRYSLHLSDVDYEGPEDYSHEQEKQALLRGETLGRKLRGTWNLADAEGKLLEQKRATLATVPYMTPRGTFVFNGVERGLANQMRLRPGVFTRVKSNGELEAHVNVLPGKGLSHRYRLEPETGLFKMDLQQASSPIVPILRALGATDDEMKKAWGHELFASNLKKDSPQIVDKLYQKLARKPDPGASHETKAVALAEAIQRMEFDPEVTQQTLGHPHANLDKHALLAITKKLLAVNRGETEPDDRDHLAYQHFLGPEDLISERFQRSHAILQPLLWRVSTKGNLQSMPAGALNKHVWGSILDSGLGSAPEEINPLDVLDQQTKVTRMGMGGIPSLQSVPDEARTVMPSHVGYIDLVRTPECYDCETEVFTAAGWKFWPAVTERDQLACQIDGRLEFCRPNKLIVADYDGPLYTAKTEFLDYAVTPNHRMWISKYFPVGAFKFEEASNTYWRSCRYFQTGGHSPYCGERLVVPFKGVAVLDWAELVGWYLSEGSCNFAHQSGPSYIAISQAETANPENCRRITALLNRLPWSWKQLKDKRGFNVKCRELANYFVPFGYCQDKWVPEEFLQATVAVRQRLLDCLLLGDGRKSRNAGDKGQLTQFCTTSEKLAKCVERLVISLGKSCRIVFEPDDRQTHYLGCHVVHIHMRRHRVINRFSSWTGQPYHSIVDYSGKIYCASVPGQLLYVRRRGSVGFWCGNSLRIGVDSRLAYTAQKGNDGRLYAEYIDAKTGKKSLKSPQDISGKVLAERVDMNGADPYVPVIKNGRVTMAPRKEVDYILPTGEQWFSPLNNLVPLKSALKGQRSAMASRFLTQALGLPAAEAPLVRAQVPNQPGVSFEELYGRHAGAVHAAPQTGRVVSVDKKSIKIKYADGSVQEHPLYENFPYNRKSMLHNTALVSPGDPVRPGQLLARSNYTDNKGHVAIGLNARIAYIPDPHGSTHEDAYVVSSSFAKRATSEHLYQHNLDLADNIKIGKKNFVPIFPAKFEKRALSNLDDNGIAKPGAVIKQGDPLILSLSERPPTHKSVHAAHRGSWQDNSVTWDHQSDGIVTDVAHTNKGITVAVKSLHPMQVGDKMSGRYGDKGVVASIIPDEEMPRDPETDEPFEVLGNPLGIISRCYDEKTEFLTDAGWTFGRDIRERHLFVCYHPWTEGLFVLPQLAPFHVADYCGPMLLFCNKLMDFCVTPNHRMWAASSYHGAPWQEKTARRLAREGQWQVPAAGKPMAGKATDFVLPQLQNRKVKDNNSNRDDIVIAAGDWAEFLGWYIAEGNVDYKVHISQSATANPSTCCRISELLNRLPFTWHYGKKNNQFHITSIRLCEYIKGLKLGLCADKRVPEWVFEQDFSTRERFLDSYLAGDGSKDKSQRARDYQGDFTMSVRLADDLQRLLIMQGISSNVMKAGPGWRVTFYLKRRRILENHNWNEIDYSGKIYCPTVPTGYVVTRRHGKMLIAGNTNPSQYLEAGLGKIAAKTGKPYVANDFSGMEDATAWVQGELDKHGMKLYSGVKDPQTGRIIPNVATGNRYIMKLMHTSESKSQGRGLGSYTSEGAPARGGEEGAGAKKMAMMNVHAMLAHSALNVLRDARLVRGQRAPEYWTTYMAGDRPATPPPSHVYQKFMAYLRASGVNVERKGSQLHIMALTKPMVDETVENRELKNADTVDWKAGFKPLPGGLFDVGLTGGHGGTKFSYIKLHEPMPNPVQEEPIRALLGLTGKQFMSVLSGTEKIDGRSGPQAIVSALGKIEVSKAVRQARLDVQNSRGARRDAAIKRLGFLKSCEENKSHPADWILDKVPVLPPWYRPVSLLPNGQQQVGDANYLYKELWDANENLKDLSSKVADTSEERKTLYEAFKGVTGLGDPIQPKNRERGIKGLLAHIFNDSPKFSVVQQKLLGTPVDLVGRAVIVPNPDLTMDEVGIPENRAWEVYSPFVVRRLVRQGVPRVQALTYLKDKHQLARKALLAEMDARPVIVNRAPVLHKYGEMAFYPRLTKGDVLQVSPFVCGGFGADFDGDEQIFTAVVQIEDLKSVLEKCTIGASPQLNWEMHKMAARFKLDLPCTNEDTCYCINAADFPHGEIIGENGHITFYSVPDGVNVFAIDEGTGKPVLAQVSGWSIHRDREVVTVELQSGRQILTDDDPRAVYGMDPETYQFVRRRPSEATGLIVPRIDYTPSPEQDGTAISTGDARRMLAQVKLNRLSGWLFGASAGNGWSTRHKDQYVRFNLATSDAGVEARFRLALDEFMFDKPHVGSAGREASDDPAEGFGASHRLVVSSNELAAFMAPLIGRGARNKHLPPFFLRGGKEFRLGLLEGLLDTDGSISVSRAKNKPQLMVNYSSASIRLLQEIQQLCRSLNVRTRITPSKTPAGEPFWVLNFSTIDTVKLSLSPANSDKALAWKNRPPVDETCGSAAAQDIVPVPKQLRKELMSFFKGDFRKQNTGIYGAISDSKDKGTMSRLSAVRLLEIVGDKMDAKPEWALFKKIVANTEVRWDTVESFTVTGIKETGYDLTVPGYETFMSIDGTILSNTMNYQVPATDEAAKEAIDRMLPSRNLFATKDFTSPMFQPRQEYLGGLYEATTAIDKKKKPRVFESWKDFMQAYNRHELDPGDPVTIMKD